MPNGLVRLSSFTLGGPSRLMRLGTDSVGNHHQDREDVEVCGRLLTAEAGIAVRRGQVVVEAHGLSGAADVVHGGADDVAAKHPTKKQKKKRSLPVVRDTESWENGVSGSGLTRVRSCRRRAWCSRAAGP